MDTVPPLRVADEVWIAAALLHRQYPDRVDFAVREIVRRAAAERASGAEVLRPGVQSHAYLHCVANLAPNPGRYRMLVETAKGRRRLYRPGDPCHPRRSDARFAPDPDAVPPAYRGLIAWHLADCAGSPAGAEPDPILALDGRGGSPPGGADSWLARLRGGAG